MLSVTGIFSYNAGPSPPPTQFQRLADGSCSSVSVTQECDMQDQEHATPTIRKRAPWN
jgi:hypothetical protein